MAFPIIPKKRSGSAGNPTSLSLGELAVNTFSGKLYLGADGGVTEIGIPVSSGTTVTERTGDGTTVAFTFSGYNGTDDGGYIVSVGGIDQPPSTYSISNTAGGTITFSAAPTAGELISIRAIVSGPAVGGDATSLRGINISQATPTTGEALVYNGSSWEADTPPADATKLQGRNIANTAPTDKQSLVWDAATSVWKPATGAGADIGGRAWSNTETYSEGDLVATSQSETWICIQNSNTGNDPATSPTWWDKMPANAITLQGSAVSATAPTTNGQVLGWNGSAWAPATANAGTVTSVTAGTGLMIGGFSGASITDTGTLDISVGVGAGQICAGDDSRLSNDRAPLAHKNNHAIGGPDVLSPDDIGAASKFRQIIAGTGLTGGGTLTADRTLAVSYGTTAGTSAQGNDSRLSNARTPTAHKSTHATGGTDALSPTDIGAAASGANTDITSVALTTGTVSTAPSGANDIATKAYADSIGSGINFHDAADYATTAALSAAYTYSNGTSGVGARITANAVGTLTIDGYTLLSSDVGKRLLIKNETGAFSNNTTPSAAFNGVYTLTTAGTASVAYVLTRATDYDTSGAGTNEINQGDFILVLSGSSNANSAWVQQTRIPITVGSTSLTFTQFAAAAAGVTSFVTTLSGLTPSGTPGTGVVSLGGTLGVSSGGTGATTQQAALNALAGATASAQFLRGNGTNVTMSAIQASDVPTLNQNTTGTAANVTGTVAVANGGSGQTSFTNGQLLIGNTTGNTLAKSTLTAGSGIAITNGAGTITISSSALYSVEYLVVAGGGGGGGAYHGGGGGAGGYRSSVATESSGGGASAESALNVTPGTNYSVVVGAGGAGGAGFAADSTGSTGSDSVFSSITALGGGGAGSGGNASPAEAAKSGGSGGGGGIYGTSVGAVGAGTSGQGYAGGLGTSGNAPVFGTGGGGGAGAVGQAGTTTKGGNGGVGVQSSVDGTATYRAGGGGGSCYGSTASGTGGSGGGGNGSQSQGAAGTTNSGGGGGGSERTGANNPGGAGGSGVVIVRYAGTQRGTGGTVTSAGGYTVHTFTASGTFTA